MYYINVTFTDCTNLVKRIRTNYYNIILLMFVIKNKLPVALEIKKKQYLILLFNIFILEPLTNTL